MADLTPAKLNYRDPATWVATWGGSGFLKPAPGTWGTLGGLPFGILFLVLGGPVVLALAAIALFPLGLWATRRVEGMTGDHDSGFIVVDEVVGIWITLLFAAITPVSVVLAFVLFRAFDALKPWPVSHFDKNVPGAMGVMLDDVAAGLMAGLCLLGLRYVGIA
ncbi:phosphatidylglycerophosphatase A family protein [Micavibrio aeruginosavorus]|uniref:Phosphatidylglycerophosphatase A family protein n=1 Tax=Micavibrio aeruginosavorus (strain ARL-13) TaxID=856793 RepID=G2KSK8_MICAA|nr:phosphatidylglycerophosphatase A [Micavibrio aeruginosavorus]AEP09608.1 phosphatidylglycerophosphatase A family protein [Micavibrio aeruginosavorus ARL-13]